MVSQLDGKLRNTIARAFRGKLKRCLLRNYTAQLDDFGDSLPSEDPEEARFEGIQENFSLFSHSQGIPEDDVGVMILLGSIKPQSVEPKQDSLIYINSKWLRVRRILDIDPANATMRVQCYEMKPQPT